mgnify:CR=1 FL=1
MKGALWACLLFPSLPLDVFAREPVDAVTGAAFADVPNLVLTPHIAGVTDESNVRVSGVTAQAVARHLRG